MPIIRTFFSDNAIVVARLTAQNVFPSLEMDEVIKIVLHLFLVT